MEISWHVAAFYQFTALPDPAGLAEALRAEGARLDLRGTVILAPEGINGTVAGRSPALAEWIEALRAADRFPGLEAKFSVTTKAPFDRFKVKEKAEIVTIRHPEADPLAGTGERVDAAAWNALLRDPDVVVIDTRNDYEIEVGRFPGAVDPGTSIFTAFPEFVEKKLDPAKQPKVAMYCTGGIRCEKATALLKKRGFHEVYHLDGGILKYLETVDPAENQWEGECFVFDERVAVDKELRPTKTWKINPATRKPVRREKG